MSDVTFKASVPQSETEHEAAIDQCFAEMTRIREQIDRDQVDIDRLRAETRKIIVELRLLQRA